MITWRQGLVVSLGRTWAGARELEVEIPVTGERLHALAYPELVGEPVVGHTVLLNVSAQARGLGTGGYALVIACPQDLPADPEPGPGHLIKARYSPLQTLVLGVDEEESASHHRLRDADDLASMPVVSADLHSALPAIIAGARDAAARAGLPMPRVCYLMTDGGALPAWFSRTVSGLREADWLTSVITTGQSFGGDLEAVSVHSGLLAAHHVVEADLTIVAQGPGNLGTGTRWGFSGVSAGEALNAASILGGHPIASLRVSASDPRPRHRGISHHSQTAFGRVTLAQADVVIPRFVRNTHLDAASAHEINALIEDQASTTTGFGRHRAVRREAGQALVDALGGTPGGLSTMGRSLEVDPTPFLAAAVAGEHAFTCVPRGSAGH